MATLSNILLSIVEGTNEVTVSGKMVFDIKDLNKYYNLEIKLLGEDLSSDDRFVFIDDNKDDEMYTFTWDYIKNGLKVAKPYKQYFIDPKKIGTYTFKEIRKLTDKELDEDSGQKPIRVEDDPLSFKWIGFADEIYAKVKLYEQIPAPSYARSKTITINQP